MEPFIRDVSEAAIDVLHASHQPDRHEPDGWIDRALLAYPDEFGPVLASVLHQARRCVLAIGDDRSKAVIAPDACGDARTHAITRARRILARRPTESERRATALVQGTSTGLTVAIAHPIPGAGASLAVRIQSEVHPDVVYARANRIEASPSLRDAWAVRCGSASPCSVWFCDLPSWIGGQDRMAIELAPNPLGFNEAMLIAHQGGGRVLVADGSLRERGESWIEASVLASGWSYLRADRTMGSSLPYFPNGAPYPASHARVPDADLFAICAAHTWAGSLRDALWLRRLPHFRVLP